VKLSHIDPDIKERFNVRMESTIRLASENGDFEVIKLLLNDPRVDPSNGPMRWASRNEHFEVVKLLLNDPRVDPSDDNDPPSILLNRHFEFVKLFC
jgi:ankyrin repeat protein